MTQGPAIPQQTTDPPPSDTHPRGLRKALRAARIVLLSAIGAFQQMVMPVMLAAAAYLSGEQSGLLFFGLVAALGTFVALVVPVGRWLPRWLMAIPLLSLFAVPAALWRYGYPQRLLPAPDATQEWMIAVLMWAVAAWFGWNLLRAWRGVRPLPGPTVDLALPLGPGRYIVLQGGSSPLVNRHLVTLEKVSLLPIRGQAYGVDIIAHHAGGLAAPNPLSFRATDYAIFGAQVRSPVRGTVVATQDNAPDHDLLTTDRDAPLGNHVWLSAEDSDGRPALLLLAHLRRGSLRVQAGDDVDRGTLLGEVGHSGNSSEPHLHIHAQRPAGVGAWLDADPLPMCFGAMGQFVRNRRFTIRR